MQSNIFACFSVVIGASDPLGMEIVFEYMQCGEYMSHLACMQHNRCLHIGCHCRRSTGSQGGQVRAIDHILTQVSQTANTPIDMYT